MLTEDPIIRKQIWQSYYLRKEFQSISIVRNLKDKNLLSRTNFQRHLNKSCSNGAIKCRVIKKLLFLQSNFFKSVFYLIQKRLKLKWRVIIFDARSVLLSRDEMNGGTKWDHCCENGQRMAVSEILINLYFFITGLSCFEASYDL